MIQLTFQAAFDPFHAIFRLLRLMPIVAHFGPLYRVQVRILDFYLLFPFRIEEIRLNPKHQKLKRLAASYSEPKPYGDLPESLVLFERMKPMQEAAMETLAANGFLVSSALAESIVVSAGRSVPEDVERRVTAANNAQSDLLDFLRVLASEYPLLGESGLKARSGLIEYRYDSV